jgi:3-phenylpropionate/trans-cinnamate dioxygenase ferredoxin subunit
MTEVAIGKVSDFKPGTVKGVRVQGNIILVAHIGGRFYTVDGRCGHAMGHLEEGHLEGNVLVCPKHGVGYDVTSGRAREEGGGHPTKAADLRSYKVIIQGDDVVLEI